MTKRGGRPQGVPGSHIPLVAMAGLAGLLADPSQGAAAGPEVFPQVFAKVGVVTG